MRYLGSKETLTDSIRTLLQNHNLLQGNLIFFDAFCGMGSVADSMKSESQSASRKSNFF